MSFSYDLVVDEDTSAIFTDDNLLPRFDIELALRWYLVEASAACITLYGDYCETIAGICPDPLVC